MPVLYSYTNAQTDPEKLWKIKRRVSKLSREVNDDNRGLAETTDMSDDVDKLKLDLSEINNMFSEISFNLQEEFRIGRQGMLLIPPTAKLFTKMDKVSSDIKKIDINKVNAQNIQDITQIKEKIEGVGGILDSSIGMNMTILQQQTPNLRKMLVSLMDTVNNFLNTLNLKLLNYKQTTAVLRETGIDQMEGAGCCCDMRLEYSPQYQNRMFY